MERVLRKVLPEDQIQYDEPPMSSEEPSASSDRLDVQPKEPLASPEASQKDMACPPDAKDGKKKKKPVRSDMAVEENENEPPSLYGSLAKIGVNVQLGLDYCCGEDEFYMEMLRMFCSQAEEKRAEIISLYEAANWTDYTVKVHALKSTSLTIGAERLAGHAKLLEQAGKKENIAYIRNNHPMLLRLYAQVCETINRFIGGMPGSLQDQKQKDSGST